MPRHFEADGRALVQAIANTATPLTERAGALDPLLESIGDASIVCLGEGSHGTHEFYAIRSELTRRLINEKGFAAIGIEGDWPDAARVHRYVNGDGDDDSADDALSDFQRFPVWMWRNREIASLVRWLHARHASTGQRIGFHGLDLYSLHASMDAVVRHLERIDPAAAKRARERYACFEPHGTDPQRYGRATAYGTSESCEREVVEELVELQSLRMQAIHTSGLEDEGLFDAVQNARLVRAAEQYYREMFRGGARTWNLRDTHMADTLEALLERLARQDRAPKVVVWAHNSHVGDARATEMRRSGELNLGQLVRERHGADTFLLGFTTFRGEVTAASDWGLPAERRRVRPALPESVEDLFHRTGMQRFLLPLRDLGEAAGGLREERLHRAIGVVYRPRTERQSHYLNTRLADQFDAVIHVDETRPIEPLEITSTWREGERPDTFPFGV
jgi:erythromycin esterase-like protein